MRRMLFSATCAACSVAVVAVCAAQKSDNGKTTDAKRPKISLHARPEFGIAPTRIVLTAELEGGSDDFEDYYCPTVVWEWGDGSATEASNDCAPYEAGQTKIKRRYTVEHTYKRPGRIRVYFSLRRHNKELTAAGVNITVQPGGVDNSP